VRYAFIATLLQHAQVDERIHLFVGDLGYSVVETFAERYPERFLNVGIAEQAMAGVAAGLALAGGKTVFTYSIGNFPTLRCLEQIRNDICYHCANVKIVAVGGGLAYGSQGYTHHAVEDLALLRALPGMVVAAPADPAQTAAVVRLACATKGPWYIRLGKNREPSLPVRSDELLKIGMAVRLAEGSHATIVATGAVALEAYNAVQILEAQGFSCRMLCMPFVKPMDEDALRNAVRDTGLIITVEEHSGYGGLGAAVAEAVCSMPGGARVVRMHLPEMICEVGGQNYLRRRHGLTAAEIAQRVRKEISN
jgi:transketolase